MAGGRDLTFRIFGQDVSASKTFKKVADSADSHGKKTATSFLKANSALVGLGAGAALGIFAKKTADAAGNFEQSMNVLQRTAGASEDQMKSLSKYALEMGKSTTFSAGEAADAMLELAKGGMTPAQIEGGGLAATLSLAATEGMGLAEASTVAANTMNMFGLEAKDAGQIADALAGASNASSASVGSLSQALSQVGPGAVNAGLSLEETVGTLAAFDQAGIKGSDSGTSLKTMLSRLIPSTDAASGAMEDLGLKFSDAQGNILPIADVAEQLKTKLGGLSEAQRITALNTIFGSDASRAASVLMKEGAAGVEKYTAAAQKRGTAEEMAAARTKGYKGAMEAFGGAVETLQINLGTKLLPALTGATVALTGFVSWGDRNQDWLVPTIGAVAALGAALWLGVKAYRASVAAMGAYRAAKQAVVFWTYSAQAASLREFTARVRFAAWYAAESVREKARAAISAGIRVAQTAGTLIHAAALGVVAAATAVWTGAQWALNAALTANPLGLIVAGIVLVVGAVILAYKRISWFRAGVQAAMKIVSSAIGWIVEAGKKVVGWIRTNWPLLLAVLTGPFGIAVLVIRRNWTTIQNKTGAVVSWITGRFDTLVRFVRGLPRRIAGAASGLWDSIQTSFRGALNRIIGWWNDLEFRLPAVSVPGTGKKIGGFTLGTPNLPMLAKGGIATGPTLAGIGEGGEPELILPLSKARSMGFGGGGGVVVNVSGVVGNPEEVARRIAVELRRLKAQGYAVGLA